MQQEKRSHSRYALWFPVTIDAASGRVWAVCNDLSAGGILISGSTRFQVGDVVTLVFRVAPQSADQRISGRIVRVDPSNDNPRDVWPHRMAIEFVEPEATLQAAFAPAPPPSTPTLV